MRLSKMNFLKIEKSSKKETKDSNILKEGEGKFFRKWSWRKFNFQQKFLLREKSHITIINLDSLKKTKSGVNRIRTDS